MRKFNLAGLFFACLVAWAAANDSPDLHLVLSDKKWDFPARVNTLDARGMRLLRRGKLAQAVRAFDQSLRIMPKNPRALANRGTALFNLHDLDRALDDYEQALALAPELRPWLRANMLRAYRQRGQESMNASEIGPAFKDLSAYIRLSGDSASSYAEVGRIAYLGGQFESCVAYADKALEADPNVLGGHADRGLCLAALGRPREALVNLDAALRLDSKRADLMAKRAGVYSVLGRHGDAVREAQRALELDPGLKQQVLPLIKESAVKAGK